MSVILKNNTEGFLATAVSASDTGLVLQSGNGANFPNPVSPDYFYATLVSSGGTQEVVRVTARSGDSMTVLRGQDGTTAQSFAAGSRLEMRVNAQSVIDTVYGITNYQGGSDTNPVTRLDGSALQTGDFYFNTVADEVRFFNGTAWQSLTTGSIDVQNFSGNASTTDFTLSVAPTGEDNTQVYVNGVYQQKDTYSISGTTLSFSVAPPSASTIEVVTLEAIAIGQTSSDLVTYQPAGVSAVPTTVREKLRETVSVKDFGAVGDGVTDDTAAVQAAVDYLWGRGGGTLLFPTGNTRVESTIDLFKGSARNITLQGEGGSIVSTTQDIVVFQIAEFVSADNLTITQSGTAKTGRAFSTNTFKQIAYNRFSRLSINSFKYGFWLRYSLWAKWDTCQFNSCGVGIKGSRNAFPDDQSDPVSTGAWNVAFFHNQNTFDNILCNGGEAGIYGVFNGCVFNNVTCQNQSSDGSANTVIPSGVKGLGLYLQSGSGSNTFGSSANTINSFYAEGTVQPLVLDYAKATLTSMYAQGAPTSGSAYEQVISLNGAVLNAKALNGRGSDWFKYRVIATNNSSLQGNIDFGSFNTAEYSVDSSSSYNKGLSGVTNLRLSATGANTYTLLSMTNRYSYTVNVTGIYNGVTAKGATFHVSFYQSGLSVVQTVAGSSADLTCTVSGSDLQLNQTLASEYNLWVTVTENRAPGNEGWA